ncbi:MAG: efflux RND transporter permease subunit, partial [Deltaproteobacteria bacterium]|nr:efflux RND transporter permease subunit [Deltaproteobacteria bacterium]
EVNVSGQDLNRILDASRMLFGAVKQAIPGAQVRPVPSLENTYPEANLVPDRARAMANGISERDLGLYVDVIMDGRQVGEYKPQQQKKMDLVLRRTEAGVKTPEDVAESLIVNGYGDLIRIKDIADLRYSQGMIQVDHLERNRTIRLEVTPPMSLPLQRAMEIIQDQVVAPMKEKGALSGVDVFLGGSADKLAEAGRTMMFNLLLAVVIVYLLMSALFENFLYPLIIMFTVPLAGAGGFIGLKLVDTFIAPQPLDILTMLGFIILIGTVVNNAILIVHQALNNARYGGLSGVDAVADSVRTRIRPIFMSAFTSVFGMLPLVLSTGPGSELYRGLGSVILGGLAVSTVFTLFVIPALLAFFIGMEKPRGAEEGAEPSGSGRVGAAAVLLLAGLVVLSPSPGNARTLEELQASAVENRELVQRFQARVDQRRQDVRVQRSPFFPSLDLSYTGHALDEEGVFGSKEQSEASAVLSYNVFSGFADRYSLAAAKDHKQVAELDLSAAISDVRLEVALAYLEVYRSRNLLEVAQKEVALLEKRLSDAKSRFEVGLLRKNDVLQLQVELANARQSHIQALAARDKAANLLARAVAAPVTVDTLAFDEFAELPEAQPLAAYMDLMLEKRSELKALRTALSAAENTARARRGPLYPRVDVSGIVSRAGQDFVLGQDEPHDNEVRATVGVTLNVFDGFADYARLSRARLEARAVSYDLAELKRSLSTSLGNIYLDYEVAVKNLEVARTALSQAEENLRITDIGFTEGVETATDVLDAVFFLSRARYNLVNARAQVFADYFRLQRMVEAI